MIFKNRLEGWVPRIAKLRGRVKSTLITPYGDECSQTLLQGGVTPAVAKQNFLRGFLVGNWKLLKTIIPKIFVDIQPPASLRNSRQVWAKYLHKSEIHEKLFYIINKNKIKILVVTIPSPSNWRECLLDSGTCKPLF